MVQPDLWSGFKDQRDSTANRLLLEEAKLKPEARQEHRDSH